jgi:hypothetical protein
LCSHFNLIRVEISEEESESEGEAGEGTKLTKSREDIKRSSFKILRYGKTKEVVPDEVSNMFCPVDERAKFFAGPCPRLQEWQEK